ncbi:MAG: hypothetical protein L3J74_02055 [Bacteroidales bacterium]|nr:hypothetical protein [Bacteroidales bacterium]
MKEETLTIMNIGKICNLLKAKLICGANLLDKEVTYGFASDLMSDVLTLDNDDIVLITGLTNMQTMRTAEISEIPCIVFVRNKKVTDEMIKIAIDNDIVLLECKYSMFKTIGILYENNLKPVY